MKKILLGIGLLMLAGCNAYASLINYGAQYTPNGQVTNVNLNGYFNDVSNVVNGGLDNTNANTTSGYRFYQTVATLPAAGNTGQVYFLTTDDSLNFDTGSTFIKTVGIAGSPVQGNVVYYGASGLAYVPTGTAGQLLTSNGAGTNPTFQSINYANVTPPYVKLSNTQSSGSNGGAGTTGSWQTIPLNTTDVDSASISTLLSNQVSLPAGTYIVSGSEPFLDVNAGQTRVYDVTDSTILAVGSTSNSPASSSTTSISVVNGEFTIAATKTIAYQYQIMTHTSTADLGTANGFGNEVYGVITFIKVA